MRITTGLYRGRKVLVPGGQSVRPTSDKVRQAVFNALESRGLVIDAVVLDVFCGSGALGLEALSRGAAYALFMDKSADSLKACRNNIEAFDAAAKCKVFNRDALRPGVLDRGLSPATLVLLDPPYYEGIFIPALTALAEKGWIADNASVVIECEKTAAEKLPPHFMLHNIRTYGDTKILYTQYKA